MVNLKWGIIVAAAAVFISIFLGIAAGVNAFHIFIRALIFAVVFFVVGFGLRLIVINFFPELIYGNDDASNEELYNQAEQARISVLQSNAGEYALPELYKTSDGSDELGNIEDLVSGVFGAQSESKGIDRNTEAGYNNNSAEGMREDNWDIAAEGLPPMPEAAFQTESFADKPAFASSPIAGNSPVEESSPADGAAFSPSFGDDSGLGGLPDLDMMARAFSTGYSSPSPPPLSASTATPTVMPTAMEPPTQALSMPAMSQDQESSTFIPTTGELETVPRYTSGSKPQPLKGDFNPKELAMGLRTVLDKS